VIPPVRDAAEDTSPDQRALDTKLDQLLSLLQEIRRSPVAAELIAPPAVSPSGVPAALSPRPRIFIGSSSEGLGVAESLQLGLDAVAECTIWNQSAFNPSATIIESLVDIGRRYEAAILVLTPDDMLTKRQESAPVPRDNLIFEAGLFTGMLGRARTFLVHPREPRMALPSDLAGVTTAAYSAPSDGNLHAALGAVCTRIKRALGLAG
jgi:predicted nucleotide-binding protein